MRLIAWYVRAIAATAQVLGYTLHDPAESLKERLEVAGYRDCFTISGHSRYGAPKAIRE